MSQTTKLMTHAEQSSTVCACVYNVAEAAAKLGLSESTIRHQAKRLGVKRIAGRVVKGFVAWPNAVHQGVTVVLPYAE